MQNTNPSGFGYVTPVPDAVTAKRKPVPAPRSQDKNPDANHGLTRVKEGGTPPMGSPHGGTQPAQPNPSSLRQ